MLLCRRLAIWIAAVALSLAVPAAPVRADPAWGTYSLPVHGPVIRGFEPPATPYSAGHRGIDIAVPFGTPIHAPADGVVAFAGSVAGALDVSIDHPDGVRTTYSWLSKIETKKGVHLARGDVFALTGHGHPDIPTPQLHFGARVGSTYIDPMLLLEPVDLTQVIWLAPLEQAGSPSSSGIHAQVRTGWLLAVGTQAIQEFRSSAARQARSAPHRAKGPSEDWPRGGMPGPAKARRARPRPGHPPSRAPA